MKTNSIHHRVSDAKANKLTRLNVPGNTGLLTPSATELASATHSLSASPNCGFTRTDLGVVVALVGLLAMLATAAHGKISTSAHRVVCANNLRQSGVATLKFASENMNFPPWLRGVMFGGSAGTLPVFQHFLTYSNYVDSPRIFVCPGDEAKQPAVDFTANRLLKNA